MTTAPPHAPPPVTRLSLTWLEQYGDDLFAFAIRRVRRTEIAEDLVQETLLAAIKAATTFGERSTVKTWLIGILRHKIADHFRSRYQHERLDADTGDESALFDRRGNWKIAPERWGGDPRRLAEMAEFRDVLNGCVSKLPARMAYLFTSRATDTANAAALCEELAITPDHAWTLLHRARLRLRTCLTARWFAGDRDAAPGRTHETP